MTDPDVREAIMEATYEALCEHGYTDLTAQDIADRTDKSKSLLFYHYDSKDDLVADLLAYLREQFDEGIETTRTLAPTTRLAMFIDWYLYGSSGEDERRSFHTALLELRTQAPHNERYREQLQRSDEQLRTTLEEILQDGIDAGEFVDHDTAETAALLLAALDGARTRQLAFNRDEYLGQVRSGVITQVIDDLLADDASFPAETQQELFGSGPEDAQADGEPSADANGDADDDSKTSGGDDS
ncbi:TetR/AcrR family transcriptional regulator [Halopiger xanaduensis]|uniref:Regulatory protein TetR n=1 Tax=Halopiger xanaduensis (strain DSM 18323 / JCM 14033 / SH-6) TaxID=797210 RepID=F8DA79_HALXS|nr:TetR/AcrR family transcriptional regulator [Halopiger xanaduensis]AEH38151.1 regulatory protein TetR [Halopiger xanaduensis SH-6]